MNSTLHDIYTLSPDYNLSISRIQSHYFSPQSLNQYSRCLNKDCLENSLAIVYKNITSLNQNLETQTTHYLDEMNFQFNVIGVTGRKIILMRLYVLLKNLLIILSTCLLP